MGLDMYLSKKTYVKQWSHNQKKDQFTVTVKKGSKKYEPIKPERVSYIVEEVAYWRKFNALHNWIVQNIQDGEDNCQESYIPDEKMEELIETLRKVKSVLETSKTTTTKVKVGWANGEEKFADIVTYTALELEELLPSASGFFFGGTEYDEYYKEEVERTLTLLEELTQEEGGDFYYQASW